jgi:hypothetical protein
MIRPFSVHIVPFAAALLFATACGAADDRESAPSGEAIGSGADRGLRAEVSGHRLEHDGVSIELPNGWEGRVLPLDYPSAVLQAANFEFVPVGVELPPGEEDPIKAMTAQHALVAILPCGIVAFEEPPRPASERVSLDNLTFLPTGHPRVPRRHAFAHGSFDFSGRCLRVEADFGGAPPGRRLKETVNAILASLSVAEK